MERSKNVGGVQVRGRVREGKEQRQPRPQVKDVATVTQWFSLLKPLEVPR